MTDFACGELPPATAAATLPVHDEPGGFFNALVLGCGPSTAMSCAAQLSAFARRNRCRVYTCNDAWLVHRRAVPCQRLVILDDGFVWDNRSALWGYLAAHRDCRLHTCFNPGIPHDRIRLDRSRRSGLHTPYIIGSVFDSGSSGIAAIQIAMHEGARRIWLIGHDLTTRHGSARSTGRGGAMTEYEQGLTMRIGYTTIARHAELIGVEIVNLSPISTIEDFEFSAELLGGQQQ